MTVGMGRGSRRGGPSPGRLAGGEDPTTAAASGGEGVEVARHIHTNVIVECSIL